LIALFGDRFKRFGDFVSPLAALVLAVLSTHAAFSLKGASVLIYRLGPWNFPQGLAMVADGLSAFLLLTANTVAFFVAVYSTGYMEKYTGKWKFHALFMIMLAGINGVLLASDIFNLYIFLEVAAIAGYFLVAFGNEAEGLEASFKYAIMGAVASSFILLGIAFLYLYTSTLQMADLALVIAGKGPSKILLVVSVLFLMGFGLKAALVPFHAWLPYAHSAAPAPVSAMLSGVSIKVLGIYALTRIFYNIFGMTPAISTALLTFAVLSMVVGSFMAFGQTDLKRLFAYSSISQIGYIALGLGVGTPLAIMGALFHLFNHSIFKSLLFLSSGSIERLTGTRDMQKIRGVIAKSPVTGYTTLVGALSICGMPPFGGFWSKLIIIYACVRAGRFGLAATAVFVAILTLAYYVKSLTPVLFGAPEGDGASNGKKALMPAMTVPAVCLAFLCLASCIFIFPGTANVLLSRAAFVVAGGTNAIVNFFGVVR
jgi:multicomponent Na+:H+ antiporter subunit D